MFSKSIFRLIAVFAFAFIANVAFGQYVDPETAIQRLDAEITELQEDINSSQTTVSNGSFQASPSTDLAKEVSLKLMTKLREDINTLKAVDPALDLYRQKASQSPAQAKEMLNNAIEQVENLLS